VRCVCSVLYTQKQLQKGVNSDLQMDCYEPLMSNAAGVSPVDRLVCSNA
jgi:hypothetical protein